jgi:hypothetical protein
MSRRIVSSLVGKYEFSPAIQTTVAQRHQNSAFRVPHSAFETRP